MFCWVTGGMRVLLGVLALGEMVILVGFCGAGLIWFCISDFDRERF